MAKYSSTYEATLKMKVKSCDRKRQGKTTFLKHICTFTKNIEEINDQSDYYDNLIKRSSVDIYCNKNELTNLLLQNAVDIIDSVNVTNTLTANENDQNIMGFQFNKVKLYPEFIFKKSFCKHIS
ncbi:hypothetical protein RFI_05074 [Reticulomyxa filosa]|uniref:Uncharacterized protein n=1 Tax=Reticulomyxa filosa TaxID=46433 RepID=X6P399_RETFI|nr:hypothetical protein RFI_05074 [Reticulomyxa filosa]|eukprot:ETO32042.1 hypothetical protein RFI_05074 [Reticulomyxa filosa]